VPSAASQRTIKESKKVERERKATFWTPVMIWPSGFIKKHVKEVKEYLSTECLHINRWPVLPPHLSGGIIIDLNHAKDILAQVKSLIQMDALESDELLCEHLLATHQALKTSQQTQEGSDGFGRLDIAQSTLI
jgi:hypothetical protein